MRLTHANTHSRRCPRTSSLLPSSRAHRPPHKQNCSTHCFTASSSLPRFWWLLLLCCLNCSSASVNNLELPKALRNQYDHQLCHLMQHTTLAQHLPPRTALRPPPCSSSALLWGTHGHRSTASPSPSADHRDHHLTTDLPRCSFPTRAGLDHSARDPLPFPQQFSHKAISFFHTSLNLEQATLLQYAHLAHLNKDEIFKKEKARSGLL